MCDCCECCCDDAHKKYFIGFGIGGGIFLCVLFPILLSLFVVFIMLMDGIRMVKYDEWGLQYNTYSQRVEGIDKYAEMTAAEKTAIVKEPGSYMVFGIGNRFITFPSIYETIDFANTTGLSSRTKDGLYMTLDISFQFKVKREDVFDLFFVYGVNYTGVITRVARDILRDVASGFNATDFFDKRSEVATTMQTRLETSLADIYATATYLQLRKVDLPDAYESVIEEKEVIKQRISKVQYEKESKRITAQTDVDVAALSATVKITEAQAAADARVVVADARATATKIRMTAETDAFSALCDAQSFNSTELLAYLWIQAVKNHDVGSLTVQLEKPAGL